MLLAQVRRDRPALATWLILASMVLNVFSGNFAVMGIPFPLDRVAFVGAVLAMVVTGVDGRRLVVRPAHGVLAASVALTVASAVWAGTLLTQTGLFALLDRVTMPALLFVLAPFAFPTEAARLLFVKTFSALGLYLGLTSVVSITGPTAMVFPRYIMDPTVGILFGRARGPFVEASTNGLALIYCGFVAAAGWWLLAKWWRLVCALAMLLCGGGALLTYTRSIWIGAGLGLVVYCAMHPRARRYGVMILGGIAGAVALAVVAVPALQASLLSRVGNVRSIDDRTTTNAAALRAFDAHPLTGVGWSNFLSVVSDYVRQQDLVPVTNVNIEAHNVLLSRAAELGIPGALLWCLTLVAVFGPAYRRSHASAASPALQQLRSAFVPMTIGFAVVAMLTPLSGPFSNAIPFLLAGILTVDHQSRRTAGRERVEVGASGPLGAERARTPDRHVIDLTSVDAPV